MATKTGVYGPYDISNNFGAECIPVQQAIPFIDVANSNMLISATDNMPNVTAASQPADGYKIVTVEVAVWGSIQGFNTLIKRQVVTTMWGPMTLRLGDSDVYTQIIIGARIFIGGKPGMPSNLINPSNAKLKVELMVHVAARGGLG
jgi:hypothetical protein